MAVADTTNLAEAFQRAQEESAFWDEHYHEFAQKYPNQFVAIHNNQVVATAPTLGDIVKHLRALGYPIHSTSIRYIPTADQQFIL